MGVDVFISYNSADEEKARLLCELLKKHGLSTWFAPQQLSPGDNYAGKIFEAIEATAVFSVLVSSNSNKSFHVKNEIELATRQISRGIIIMPILLDHEQMDQEVQYYLSRQQWLDASNPPINGRLEEYCIHICNLLKKERTTAFEEARFVPAKEENIGKNADYQAYANKGNFQTAIELLEKEIELYGTPVGGIDSTYAMKNNVLGRFYERISSYDKSIHAYEQALEYAPDHALSTIHANLATTYMAAGKWKQAIDHYTTALVEQRLEFGRQDPNIYAARSNAYFKVGDLENAEQDYMRAIQMK